jgi:Ca-activated chloride channel family protein
MNELADRWLISGFLHPERLFWLLALVPLAIGQAYGARRRAREWTELAQSGRPGRDGSFGWLMAALLVILALAQPRWGRLPGFDSETGSDVVILVDTSRSMAAEDARPSRLGVAIEAASSLIQALDQRGGSRVAVVEFAGRAVVRCPLTASLDAAIEILGTLRPGTLQPGGTDLGQGLAAAIGLFDPEGPASGRTIVVFSDGEDHVGRWPDELATIGDAEAGAPLPEPAGLDGPGRRPSVVTRRSDAAAEALARETGGAVVPLGLASTDLGTVFMDRIEPVERKLRSQRDRRDRVERFPIFLLGALGVGLLSSWPRAPRSLGRGLAALGVVLAACSLGAGGSTARDEVARGMVAYQGGRYDEALARFEAAIALEPTEALPWFDAASTLFQLKRYAEAVERYEQAGRLGDAGMAMKVEFALGNTSLALGDIPGAIEHYDRCLAAPVTGRAFEAIREDAAENRAFASRRIPPPPPESVPAPRDAEPTAKKSRPERVPKPSSAQPGGPDPAPASPAPDSGTAGPSEGTRGQVGAGGSGAAPPAEGSPEARLDAALKNVREAIRSRPGDSAPRGAAAGGKDW